MIPIIPVKKTRKTTKRTKRTAGTSRTPINKKEDNYNDIQVQIDTFIDDKNYEELLNFISENKQKIIETKKKQYPYTNLLHYLLENTYINNKHKIFLFKLYKQDIISISMNCNLYILYIIETLFQKYTNQLQLDILDLFKDDIFLINEATKKSLLYYLFVDFKKYSNDVQLKILNIYEEKQDDDDNTILIKSSWNTTSLEKLMYSFEKYTEKIQYKIIKIFQKEIIEGKCIKYIPQSILEKEECELFFINNLV